MDPSTSRRSGSVRIARAVGAVLAGLAVLSSYGCSCSTREPRIGLPPLGKTITILPSAVNATGPVQSPDFDKRAVLYTIMFGGRPMTAKDNPVLRFYSGEPNSSLQDRKLLWEVKWVDLREAWRKNCDPDEIAVLDGPAEGRALACDFGLSGKDLAKVTLVEGVDETGEQKLATSFSTWTVSDEVVGANIQLLMDSAGVP